MARQAKTQHIIDVAYEILSGLHPMTVRQVYYQLVSRLVIENNRSKYQAVSSALVDARKEGDIPWGWIEDRLRKPVIYGGYDNLADFAKYLPSQYQRDFWVTQENVVECWVEKDALSGVFGDVLGYYRVTYNVGRGFDGWSSIYNASQRYEDYESVTILYFGDFDPSGEEMVTSLEKRLNELDCFPDIHKVALTKADVLQYDLPSDFTKATDTRSKKFIEQHGDMAVELDALPVNVLRSLIVQAVEPLVNLEALAVMKELERKEKDMLKALVEPLK